MVIKVKDKPEKCECCSFYEEDHANDDADWVEGWGCCCPANCPKDEMKIRGAKTNVSERKQK